MLRKARIGDVKTIHRLINISSGKGEMLPRSLMDIYGNLRDFVVYQEDGLDEIRGICAMNIVWENLAEIRSLYVDEEHRMVGSGGSWWRPAFPRRSRWISSGFSP